ncbi:MAG: COQ9 family protein [Paracoccaceae bacterium]
MPDDPIDVAEAKAKLLDAILPHVVFDGWSETALKAAAMETGIAMPMVRVILPRGAADLAVAWHRRGDRELADRLAADTGEGLRYSEKVARAVRLRLEAADREIVRRGAALFALPQHAPTGARMIWETADCIWRALGDTSDDVNWYSKRAILSGVWSSTVLFWLADESPGHAATWAFLDRRIADVMRFEKFKAQVRDSRVLGPLLKGPLALLSRIRAPKGVPEEMPQPTGR